MTKPAVCLVKRNKELKNKYNNASDTEILQHIISKNPLKDRDPENIDFTSRNKLKLTEAKILYIKKCIS